MFCRKETSSGLRILILTFIIHSLEKVLERLSRSVTLFSQLNIAGQLVEDAVRPRHVFTDIEAEVATVHGCESARPRSCQFVLADFGVWVLGRLTEQPLGVDRVSPLILVHGILMVGHGRVGDHLEVNSGWLLRSVADLV